MSSAGPVVETRVNITELTSEVNMDWITIIESLLPLVSQNIPGAAEDEALAEIAIALIKRIKSQSNMTTDQIIDRAGLTTAENKIKIAEEMARLNAGGGSGSGTGGGSGSGTGGNP